jgi:hypothetical protein
MSMDEKIKKRFTDLAEFATNIEQNARLLEKTVTLHVNMGDFEEWATSVLGLLQSVFGENSPYYKGFLTARQKCDGYLSQFLVCRGSFQAAYEDYSGGYITGVEKTISGEVLGDLVALAKEALHEGNKDAAAVLAGAALEDSLKRYASQNGLTVSGKNMSEVVSALKSKGLVQGGQKTLLDDMPKLRDYAMHAEWDKLTPESVASIIGFVEQFLLSHFS